MPASVLPPVIDGSRAGGAMGDDGDDDYDDGFGDENTQESLVPSWPIAQLAKPQGFPQRNRELG